MIECQSRTAAVVTVGFFFFPGDVQHLVEPIAHETVSVWPRAAVSSLKRLFLWRLNGAGFRFTLI